MAATNEKKREEALKNASPPVDVDWDPKFGDRRCEIVFIGMGMNQEEVRVTLDAALVTGKPLSSLGPSLYNLFGLKIWKLLLFPRWNFDLGD